MQLPQPARAFPLVTSLIALLFLYSFSPWFAYTFDHLGWNDKRASQMMIVGVACLLALLIPCYRSSALSLLSARAPAMPALIIFWLLLSLLSSIFAKYPLRSIQDSGLSASVLLVALCCYIEINQIKDRTFYRWLGLFFVLATAVLVTSFASYCLVFIQYGENLQLGARSRWVPHFANPRAFNDIQIWVLPVALLCFARASYLERRNLFGVALWLAIAFWWALIFFTLARGVMWAMILGLGVVVILCLPRSVAMLKPIASTFVGGVMLYGIVFLVIPWALHGGIGLSYGERIADVNDSGRFRLWSLALQLIRENPLLGVGGQHYSLYSGSVGSAHNMWLNWGAEQGLLSLLLLLLAVGLLCHRMYRKCAVGRSPAVQFLTWQLAAALLYSGVAGLWISPLSQLLMAFSLALYIRVLTPYIKADPYSESFTAYAKASLGLLVGLAAASVGVSVADLVGISETSSLYAERNFPRFWLDGHHFFSR